MTRRTSRRKALAVCGATSLASLAGCGSVSFGSSEPPQLELSMTNFSSEPQLLNLELLRTDADTRNEARVLDRSFELAASEGRGEAYSVPESPTVEDRRYLLRASLSGRPRRSQTHYHYYPDCRDADIETSVLAVDVFEDSERPEPYVFVENYGCQRDETEGE
ncbi:hypothetical protein AUR64_17205 [Haloprofundus marisrubri]|uniref:Uncharacterized protein n=1 Tax=Haloprofundus marisrubri TaxID=1514971 RepID=A0A0W1R8J8_9EURY|nr:hypothetical protein [Haloprofundus marisrubri]KTG09506.1 hypothetical protein AUR64_17205 [Haloprofundus marisrubri]